MEVIPLAIPDVKVIIPKKFGDNRGFFAETFSRQKLADCGIDAEFVQDNHSMSGAVGTIRALHYQIGPQAQAKLIRVLKGAVLDVAVDIRRDSPTFGQYVAEILSADNFKMMYVPTGFAHGFETLEPNTEVFYKVTRYYSPSHERGIRWNDPAISVPWKVAAEKAVLSAKDQIAPMLAQVSELF
ncbi:MAG: dTDP-4-dehydrorhamnose 3,5-epimerase [Burkholderiales bacterium]|nr:dTDP-4-dehydrorhamnose 3,5-epimerase [Phycisphaerae bacterium]